MGILRVGPNHTMNHPAHEQDESFASFVFKYGFYRGKKSSVWDAPKARKLPRLRELIVFARFMHAFRSRTSSTHCVHESIPFRDFMHALHERIPFRNFMNTLRSRTHCVHATWLSEWPCGVGHSESHRTTTALHSDEQHAKNRVYHS